MTRPVLFRLLMAALVMVGSPIAGLVAQEVERDLQFVPVAQDRATAETRSSARGGGSLSLPFLDDFASPTFAADAGPAELVRWTDGSARRTTTYAIDPPTFGVATLDGLRANGFPYAFNEDATGWADTLTSVPVNLAGRTPEDDIYLTFFYQGGGRGNAPDENDSLVVEFFAPDGGEEFGWSQVWSVTGAEMDTFALASVHVDQLIHWQAGVRFRVRNPGAPAGNVDLWHSDSVYLDDFLDPDNLPRNDLAFVEVPHAMTAPYSVMPWTHYLVNPASFIADSARSQHRNLRPFADNVTTGFKVRNTITGAESDFLNPYSEPNVPANSAFSMGYYIQEPYVENGMELIPASGFAFEDADNDTAATFEVSFYSDVTGDITQGVVGVPDNDSIVFVQGFRNEYAYDDGTAEKAYGLTTGGGKLAVRYDLAMPDTLYGLAIHFTPYYNQQTNLNFLMRAWADDNGVPGEELGENYLFHQPAYFTDGHDVFAYYEYDDPIPVEGTVYVGMVQEMDFSLNIGLDKNTDYNFTRVHYQLGLGAEWVLSTIQGTVMIRPVLQAGVDDVFVAVEEQDNAPEASALEAWPNPASGQLTLAWSGMDRPVHWSLVDLSGRTLDAGSWPLGSDRTVLAVPDLPRGLALVVIEGADGTRTTRRIALH